MRRMPFAWLGLGIGGGLVLCIVTVSVQHLANAETKTLHVTPLSDNKLDMKKLDKILEQQHTILQKLDAMMEELQVIKVRATR